MIKATKSEFFQPLRLFLSLLLLFCLIACGGSADTADTGGDTGGDTTGTPTLTLTLSSTAVTFGAPITATAMLRDASGALVDGAVVTFTASSGLVTFTPASATALTYADTINHGVASIIVSATDNNSDGATYITASASITSGGTTTNVTSSPIGISVGKVAVTLGTMTLGASSISAYGTSSVSVPVLLGGSPATVPISVSFTSDCVSSGKAIITSPVTNNTSSGIAISTYKDNGCSGADTITASVTGGSTASRIITVATPVTNNIQFISATPEIIKTGGESSLVTFKVRDANNNGKSGVLVDFSLVPSDTSLGIQLSSTQATSLSDGTVSTSITSGAVPTPVWVVAKVNGSGTPGILSQSNKLTITTGLAAQNFFSLSASSHNIEGWDWDNITSTITIIASDRLADPVPDGTVINFIAEGAHFNESTTNTATCSTLGGICTVTFISAAYKPAGETIDYGGSVGVKGAVPAFEYDGITPITITYYDGTNSGPLYVQNGRVTMLAYVLGEESFVDADGDNTHDSTETFYDIGHVYVDSNENGHWDSNSSQPGLAEQFITYSTVPSPVACGTHIGGGSTITAYPADYVSSPSKETTCNDTWGQNYVRREQVIVLSGSNPQLSQYKFQTNQDCFSTYYFWLMDQNYNPMPKGTGVAVNTNLSSVNYSYSNSGTITNEAASIYVGGSPVPDSTHAGGTLVSVTFNGGTSCMNAESAGTIISYPRGSVTLDITAPQGLLTQYTIVIANPSLTLAADPTSVAAGSPGGTSTLTATFTDIYGHPVEGLTVNFSRLLNSSGCTLDAASDTTDVNGIASITYTAGSTGGVSDIIGATATYNGYHATSYVTIPVTTP